MKKICYLADASSTHTKKFCDYFSKHGYEIYVISLNEGEIDSAIVYSLDYEVKKLKNEKTFKKIGYLKSIKNIKKIIKDIKPDIVHAHFASSYGLLGSLVNFKPYIISVWGTDIYEFPKSNIINKHILKYNLKKADIVLSTSKAMAQETSLYTNKNIYITPFGVDVNLFKPIEKEDVNKDSIVIGTIKTLEDKYGIDYLIKGFKYVKEHFPDKKLKLIIGGEGSKREYLQKLSKELEVDKEISFIGYVNQSDIVEVFNRFDIAVFPSLRESFGVAAVEAEACGIPVVATNVGGLPEATKNGESAILVNSQNEKELGEAIIELIEDEKKRNKMGLAAREFVCKELDVNDNFKIIESLYTNVLKK
ncbi:glycosyltransferase [Paraclostridium ghonii]|uniref:Glycosyltransferase involved in cell wall biosynthesis n=1 Tax=Paraclostridium ghonii TaxID=29358 RepID=A0ABU0MWB9_9FIRM|nr:glycosyltransferase [Paeniclostridium ghonii]MDQ0554903.1 glycosyltransferase involved in cell wall biosynthesis [Paeniclostridium ghonii]